MTRPVDGLKCEKIGNVSRAPEIVPSNKPAVGPNNFKRCPIPKTN